MYETPLEKPIDQIQLTGGQKSFCMSIMSNPGLKFCGRLSIVGEMSDTYRSRQVSDDRTVRVKCDLPFW